MYIGKEHVQRKRKENTTNDDDLSISGNGTNYTTDTCSPKFVCFVILCCLGTSDPYFKLFLEPAELFPDAKDFKTKVEKRTVTPLYDEKFTFK